MRHTILALALSAGLLLLATAVQAGEFDDLKAGKTWTETNPERVGTAALVFLKLSQSARVAGMGDAYTAVADDINAAFWNPAGLTHVRRFAWMSTYTRWFVGTNLFSGAVAYNTGSDKGGVVGFSLVYLKPEDVEETTIYKPEGTGRTIHAMDMAIGVVYAHRMTDKLSVGFKADWVREAILGYALNTFKFDVGSLFYTGFHHLRVAMSLKNLGKNNLYLQVPFWMPLNYYMAVSDEIYGKQGDPAYLTVAVETLYSIDYKQRYHLGAELWMGNTLAIRGGYKFNYNLETYTLGAGLKFGVTHGRKLTLDVSYTNVGELLQAPLRFTMGGVF